MATGCNTYKEDSLELEDLLINAENDKGASIDTKEVNSTMNESEDKTAHDEVKSGGHIDDAVNAVNAISEVDINPATSVEIKETHNEKNAVLELVNTEVSGSLQEDLHLGVMQTVLAIICCNINPAILTIMLRCFLNVSDVASDFGLVYYLYSNEERTKIILIPNNDL